MGKPTYQRVVCMDCTFEHIGKTAMMLGKKHHLDHNHTVHWTQEVGGVWRGEDA